MLNVGIFLLLVTMIGIGSGCISWIDENHYFRSQAQDSNGVSHNFYKVHVGGSTFGSSARYLAGYFDEAAVDSYFSEFSQPAKGKLPNNASTPEASAPSLDTKQDPGSPSHPKDTVEPLKDLKGSKLILILSSNSDEVATQIGAIADNQKLGSALSRAVNKDKILAAHRSGQEAKSILSDQQDLAAKGKAWISDLDETKTDRNTLQQNVLQYLNAIGAVLGSTSHFATFDEATSWLNSNRSKLLEQ